MSKGAQLYNFRIDLSDIDNNHYGLITYKSVLHPSETLERMVIRSILYAVYNYKPVDFTKGVCVGDEPDLWAKADNEKTDLWLEIGLPTNERLHKICRDSNEVMLFLYGKAYNRFKCQKTVGNIHDHNLKLFSLDEEQIQSITDVTLKNNHWTIIIQDNEITIINGSDSYIFKVENVESVN